MSQSAQRAILRQRIENDFIYHPPVGPEVTATFGAIRSEARVMAQLLVELCPPTRELHTALTRLEECVMHANAGIARNQHKVRPITEAEVPQ